MSIQTSTGRVSVDCPCSLPTRDCLPAPPARVHRSPVREPERIGTAPRHDIKEEIDPMPMLSSLRNWFGRPGKRGACLAPARTLLHLERLEAREVPAALPTLRLGAPVNTGHMAG